MNKKNILSVDGHADDDAFGAGDESAQLQFTGMPWSLVPAADFALAPAATLPAGPAGKDDKASGSQGASADLSALQNATIAAAGGISSSLSLPTDPLLAQQWHLHNPTAGLLDLNVFGVWNPAQGAAYTGAGIRTVVIDNGFDYLHTDLAPNYDTGLDFDFADVDLDPFGTASDAHGTAVTGIIGADNNGTGAVGVAFDTSLVGYRTYNFISDFWLQNIRDAIHHSALSAAGDVVNISQGIANDAASEFGVGYLAVRFDEIETSIGEAVNQGRGGLGTIIVKSAGNSRTDNYDVNADDWGNDTRQVVVAAVDQNGFVSSYSSYGAAVLVSGFGTPGQVVTTDRTGAAGYNATDFTSSFNGTSAAAPMVSGVVALMLDANPGLGWRDVQNILAGSARQVGSEVGAGIAGSERYPWQWNASETWNGGGMHFSNDYGFGLVDALAAVRLSETWLLTGIAPATTGNQFTNTMDVLNASIIVPDGNATGLSFAGSAGFDDLVDRVTVSMTFSTTFTGDLELYLTSPDGTVSQLIADTGGSNDFNGNWTFETQAFRGQRAAGTWTVRVVDDAFGDVLNVSDIVIRTYGAFDSNDRYVFTNEYSDYAGIGGHATAITDSNGGANDTVNAAAVTSASVIRLDGAAGSIDGVGVSFTNIEHAIGGDGGDLIVGNSGGNMLFGMRGNDTLDGGSGTDTLRGGDGNDVLIQSFGGPNEIMDGGAGNDTGDWSYSIFDSWVFDLVAGTATIGGVTYAQLTSIENVVGGQQADNIIGNGGANSLVGSGGDDTIDGGSGTDTLRGGEGNDLLIQNFGGPNEIMDGGNGNDTGSWAYSTFDSWVFDLNAGTATIGGTAYALLNSIENVIGGQLADRIVGDGGANSLVGEGGNDTIDGGSGTDTLRGGEGDDVLIQNFGGPNEIMDGGNGNDTGDWSYSGASWVIDLNAGTANIGATTWALLTSIENLVGAQGSDHLIGDGNANSLVGGNGNDTLDGGNGTDTLIGGEGDDLLIQNFGGPNEIMDGGNGNDTGSWSYSSIDSWTINLLAGQARIGATVFAQLTSIENAIGGQLADTLVGSDDANFLGGEGGNDLLIGGLGVDTVSGGLGDDLYIVNLTAGGGLEDVVSEAGGGGIDTLQLAGSSTNLVAVTLNLASDLEHLNAFGTGTSLLNFNGNASANFIRGNAANNVIAGGAGADTIAGYGGDDLYIVNLTAAGALEDTVTEAGGSGIDTLQLAGVSTNVAAVTLVLASGFENLNAFGTGSSLLNLTGNTAANFIRGNAAGNILTGGAGADTLAGYGGNDTYVVNLTAAGTLEDAVTEAGGSGIDTLQLAGSSTNVAAVTLVLASGFEHLNAFGTGSSLLNLTGNSAANFIRGNAAGNILTGGAGADSIAGYGGDDTYVVNLTAAGGLEDVITESGGSGIDTVQLTGSSTNVAAVTLTLASGFENLNAFGTGTSLLNLTGNTAANFLRGNGAGNVLTGGAGADTIAGYGGDDTYVVNLTAAGALEDVVTESGGSGIDTLRLAGTSTNVAAVTLTLASGFEHLDSSGTGTSLLNLTGNTAANAITGNAANNVLTGGSGADTLSGLGGNDTLIGGVGKDNLAGGTGNDTFDFNALGEMGLTNATWDVVVDFASGDKIDLSTLDANTATGIDDAFDTLFVGGSFSGSFASAGDLFFDTTTQVLWGNTDADAAAEFAVQLVGVATLAFGDLVA